MTADGNIMWKDKEETAQEQNILGVREERNKELSGE